jgi:hypothetical protein
MPVTIVGNNTPTAGGVVYGDGANYASTSAGTSGQVLISGGASVPTWSSSPSLRENVQVVGTNTNAVAATVYVITANMTLTLPASPTAGDWVGFSNRSGVATPTIARNGSNIMSLAEDMTLDTTQARGVLVYADATRGWTLLND